MQMKVGDPVRFVGIAANIAGKEGTIKALGAAGTIAEFAPTGDDVRTYVVSTLLLEPLVKPVYVSRAPE